VRKGRKEEFSFLAHVEPPDPQAVETFEGSNLQLNLHTEGEHGALFRWYQDLLRLRREVPSLAHLSKQDTEVTPRGPEKVLLVTRCAGEEYALIALSFSESEQRVSLTLPSGGWTKRLDAQDERYGGPGADASESFQTDAAGDVALTLSPWGCLVYQLTAAGPGANE
jgi:maltooligosyltrehalose trehalohydrolase